MSIGFKEISLEEIQQLPQEVVDWFLQQKKEKGIHVFTWKDENYLLITLGMRPNPGYRIEVINVEGDEKETDVFIEEIFPDKDKFYPQVVVYPFVLAVVSGSIRVWLVQPDRQVVRFR
ncbi:protease complex subunit PrcB family protein [Thermoflavimicrobium daqui]|jgi:hypothetical protein|uniref:PrcB C-terminal domain-containing protein n=1 Tax=Thermoflavimicrobium daqui TaxID=2137476 RepID=A0A364K8G7_9BACL|nr:protease complex subunit PrcB family protein [Thermoflavimicrobium daqui]RAL26584.1 hypothetical protein DL897_00595 [Thermoflavimicrobium daqui]